MKSLLRHSALACALLIGAAMTPALAQETFKVGFVNTEKIFREANASKAAEQRLDQEFSKRDKDLLSVADALKADSDKLERDAPTLSEAQRTARQKDLVDRDRDFQRKRREFQEDYNTRRNEELQQILEQANRVVQQVAEAEKYDVVLQEVVYINPKYDITDRVIKALNSGVGAKK